MGALPDLTRSRLPDCSGLRCILLINMLKSNKHKTIAEFALTPQKIDLLICPRWIVPIEPADVTLEDHAVAVDQGRIIALLPVDDARQRFLAKRTEALPEHVLLPGLINLHTHAAMTLLRGYADDLPLMRWLQEKIWPAEGRWMSADFVRTGTLLAAAEMLRGGVTCCQDMYFFPEAAAEAFTEAGMRAVLGMAVLEFPTPYAADAADYLAKGLAARDRFRDHPLVSFTLAPHAPYTVSDASFERVATLAAQLELPIHIHLHETRQEITDSLQQHGLRPLERLRRLGLVGPDLIAVHGVHLDGDELSLLATHGASLAHCPSSNMKLASGAAPVAAALKAGMRVGLGTDGAASNNRLDMFQEMRHAALLGKLVAEDAAALNAHSILRMATLNGAEALGMGDRLGSLECGKQADICAVRLDDLLLQPCFDPAAHLVYAAGREHVSHVWVKGKSVVSNSQLDDMDLSKLLAMVRLWQNRMAW